MKRISSLLIISKSVFCNVSAQKNDEIRLLVRGDDNIGTFVSANQACIDASQNGIVRSLEVMAPCAWFPENEPGRSIREAKWKLTEIETEFREKTELVKKPENPKDCIASSALYLSNLRF